MTAEQTSAEGLIKLWVEAPSAGPSCRYLEATQHPWLIWGKKVRKKERLQSVFTLMCCG